MLPARRKTPARGPRNSDVKGVLTGYSTLGSRSCAAASAVNRRRGSLVCSTVYTSSISPRFSRNRAISNKLAFSSEFTHGLAAQYISPSIHGYDKSVYRRPAVAGQWLLYRANGCRRLCSSRRSIPTRRTISRMRSHQPKRGNPGCKLPGCPLLSAGD